MMRRVLGLFLRRRSAQTRTLDRMVIGEPACACTWLSNTSEMATQSRFIGGFGSVDAWRRGSKLHFKLGGR